MIRALSSFLVAFTLSLSPLHAQDTFWGLSSYGGQNNAGTVFTLNNAGVFTKKADLQLNDGNNVRSELIKGADGYYYGVSFGGGYAGVGLLFRFDPVTSAYTILHHMLPNTGSNPDKGVMQASNGKLYGVCRFGGANGKGTLYEYDLTTSTFTKRHDFDGSATGQQPRGRLHQVGNVLVGVTQEGGTANVGTIFDFNINTNVLTRRVTLVAAGQGANPASGLAPNNVNAQLYGVCTAGGANGFGTIYSYNPTTFGYTKRFDMTGAVGGAAPFAELAPFGNAMYGLASAGGTNGLGTVFSWDVSTLAFTAHFNLSTSSGNTPYGRMIYSASNALFYGLTSKGGNSDKGVLYSFNPATNAYVVRYNLNSGNAANPYAGLLEDGAGVLYGTVSSQGSNGSGAIFRFLTATVNYTELLPLGRSTGAYPKGSLLQASNGLFYGVASGGGTSSVGTVFSIDPATSVYTPLANFSTTLGTSPTGRLVQVGQLLYGVCETGGANTGGTLFSFNIGTNAITKILDLQNTTGKRPLAGMMLASNGLLYGTTSEGGDFSFGTIYTLNPTNNAFNEVHQFTPGDGSVSAAELIQASNNNLYGVRGGVSSQGLVFSLNPTTNAYTVPVTFSGPDGAAPTGALVEALPGTLYGITREGGVNGFGVIFSYAFGSGTFTLQHEMTLSEGSASEGGLVLGSDSKLYGTTSEGGANDLGTLFQFDPAGQTVTLLRTLDYGDGVIPLDGMVKAVPTASPGLQLNARVILEGPYVSGTGLMNDALRVLGTFPTSEPFTAIGFTNVEPGTVTAPVLAVSGNNAVVDWILVELRDKNNNTVIVTAVPALLQRDGDIVALDGVSALTINQPADNYYIAVRHRNHLGVLTLNTVALSGTLTSLDLTTGAVPLFGTAAQKQIGSIWASWAGNTVRNNQLKYTGASNDRDPILVAIGGSSPTLTIAGYRQEDCNMDGTVKYTGGANDRDIILVNIGGSSPTATRNEQLP